MFSLCAEFMFSMNLIRCSHTGEKSTRLITHTGTVAFSAAVFRILWWKGSLFLAVGPQSDTASKYTIDPISFATKI
jgi:hypothetical protein